MERSEFKTVLDAYKAPRAAGDKHHKRVCDVITRSQSPQREHRSVTCFLRVRRGCCRAGVHLLYHADGDSNRVVLEAYPGVAARSLIGKRSYKNDTKKKQTLDQGDARLEILDKCRGGECKSRYGFALEAPYT